MSVALDDRVLVAGQIGANDVAALKAVGVTLIVNNRPEGESPDQPAGHEIEAAAHAAGMGYVAIPIFGLPDDPAVTNVSTALANLPQGGRALMFCRSGMRSTAAWALAMSRSGVREPGEIRSIAARAGYDLSRLPL